MFVGKLDYERAADQMYEDEFRQVKLQISCKK